MSIRRGSDYGAPGRLPDDAPIASSDAELARLAADAIAAGIDPVIGLVGGDLLRTLGAPAGSDRVRGPDALVVPIDLGHVEFDGTRVPFVAHVITGRPFGRDWCAVMNAQFLGDLDLGPRAHPGDGLLDITTGTVRLRDRRAARRRARTGTHLPHPDLSTLRVDHWSVEFGRPVEITVDGVVRGRSTSIAVRLTPDAFRVVI